MEQIIKLQSLDDTKTLANNLLTYVKPNMFFLLKGELGAGKTTFSKLLLEQIGVKETVTSPTFVLMNQYQVGDLLINHIDAYRLSKTDDIEMFVEQFDDAFTIIEWYENLDFDFAKEAYLIIEFIHVNENERLVKIIEKDE